MTALLLALAVLCAVAYALWPLLSLERLVLARVPAEVRARGFEHDGGEVG